jgi:hypothetical protein
MKKFTAFVALASVMLVSTVARAGDHSPGRDHNVVFAQETSTYYFQVQGIHNTDMVLTAPAEATTLAIYVPSASPNPVGVLPELFVIPERTKDYVVQLKTPLPTPPDIKGLMWKSFYLRE